MNEKTARLTMSVQEAAEQLGISEATMYQLAHSEGFPTIPVSRCRIRISREGLVEWVRRHEGQPWPGG